MIRRFRKTSQPPIDRPGRKSEGRSARAGVVIVLAAAALIAVGLAAVRVIGDGQEAVHEWELIQAATVGGIQPAPATTTSPASQPGSRPALQRSDKKEDFCPT